MTYPSVYLKRGRDYPVRRGHPWVFSGAINRMDPNISGEGETVAVRTCDGEFLGVGSINTRGAVAIRIWTRQDEPVDVEFFRRRLRAAVELRSALGFPVHENNGACRVVYGEADGLPGVIVDKYASVAVVQILAVGAERLRDVLLEVLRDTFPDCTIYERSDGPARTREGLEPRCGLAAGAVPDGPVPFVEDGVNYRADVQNGQKTGFYLDQRNSRRVMRVVVGSAAGRRCGDRFEFLNLFSYTGAFGVEAALAAENVHVLNVDTSEAALALAIEHARANGVEDRFSVLEGNAFHLLRKFRDSRRKFDAIVLDPPRFATSPGSVNDACRGYKDLNLLAMKLLRPGGLLFTFSCSGRVDASLFWKVVSSAAQDAEKEVRVVYRFHQAADHPVPLSFPEADYLKGLLCVVF